MLNLNTRLKQLEESGKKINIGLVGAGQMGRGMTSQMFCMKGIRPAVISDINVDNAKKAYTLAGINPDDIAVAKTPSEAEEAISRGKYVVTDDLEVVTKALPVDVVIDATGVPEVGAQLALESIYNGKHIVMLNVETDVTVGPILKKMADSAGVVYTVSAGDEPGAIKELYDFADGMGFEVVVVGKGKNNPLNLDANPDTVREKAEAQKMNPKMLASFVDGTKTMVEMTAVSNAIGFLPTQRGLIGLKATVKELPKLLSLKEEGGILDRYQVVEYINGIAPGVFVIVRTNLPAIREEMAYLSMGEGPNYVLYRPYHLTSIETPLSAARAYIYHEPTIAPKGAPVSETVTVAKKDLKAGEHLDSIGGYTVYGVIDTFNNAKKQNALPIGLVNKNVVLKKDIKKGETITYDAVELDESSLILQLRRMQDRLIR
ncbi:NAD(P)-dependent oxidoreductase [Biomaibacter acetigenes]|jgi:predicted homoserine dehydrogenase-like protein|uniref:NAD(P)-dependent oxidoreductase n=1 Tax=Biomaibacter acetigenes TaxID=2316383 RepID=A0A3G2R671_9FIRM|nr:SAF domain-containing protein [Biomaibacter acetigenes]AYO30909.1 NAD(P)-dependent oxidoreductase [Biomaibacter acetigenes]RKL61973.1 NAD(P)-dependent oxidoreductase [Thermoanaerobacteraceae bacterium SP2]